MTAYITDTETTGTKEPQIIQLAYMDVSDPVGLAPGFMYGEFFKPSKPIELGALATHHILDEDLQNKAPHTEACLSEDTTFLIGHNIDFDWEVLGKPDIPRICTLAMCRSLYPKADSHSLGAMLYQYNRNIAHQLLQSAHNAETDVRACYHVLRMCIDEYRDRFTGPSTWAELHALSEEARIPEYMAFGKHKGMHISRVPRDYISWLRRQPDLDPYLKQALDRYGR